MHPFLIKVDRGKRAPYLCLHKYKFLGLLCYYSPSLLRKCPRWRNDTSRIRYVHFQTTSLRIVSHQGNKLSLRPVAFHTSIHLHTCLRFWICGIKLQEKIKDRPLWWRRSVLANIIQARPKSWDFMTSQYDTIRKALMTLFNRKTSILRMLNWTAFREPLKMNCWITANVIKQLDSNKGSQTDSEKFRVYQFS